MKKRKKSSLASLLLPLAGLVIAIIAFTTFQLYRSRAAVGTVDLSLNGPTTVGLNQTFSVDVLANTNGLNASAISLELSYDPNLVTLVGYTSNNLLPQTLKELTINNGKANLVIGNLCSSGGCAYFKGTGKLGTFSFKSLSNNGNVSISLVPSLALSDFHTQAAVIEATNINVAKIVSGVSLRVGNATPTPSATTNPSPSPTPREGTTGTNPTPTATPLAECIQSTTAWVNESLSLYQNVFTVEFDATPNGSRIDSVTGVSYGAANEFDDLATSVRFLPMAELRHEMGQHIQQTPP